jgi:ABC-type uncharacterized transport system fused permease/ATPase subunit
MYERLREHLPDATFISIAHGASVSGFHEAHVVFQRSGTVPGHLIEEAPA